MPPERPPQALVAAEAGDRIGTTTIDIDVDKVVAIVETDAPDRNSQAPTQQRRRGGSIWSRPAVVRGVDQALARLRSTYCMMPPLT